LRAAARQTAPTAVRAVYDTAGHRLFVTGKNWPSLCEIRLFD